MPLKPSTKKILMLVDGLDITNGVSMTCRELARHWEHTPEEWELHVYGTSVKPLKEVSGQRATITVEKSILRMPVIGYKDMWLCIPIFELLKLMINF